MIESTKIPLTTRKCEQCSNDDFEPLWRFEHLARTRNKTWLFDVRMVICKVCGFVCTSPSLDEKHVMNFYADSFSKFQEQRLDYDVSNRIKIIEDFCVNRSLFLEIGANLKTKFHSQVETIFDKVSTIEPNGETADDYKNFDLIDIKASCIAHYFVLEHVPNIHDFLSFCFNVLEEDGIMICEVPSLEKYEKFTSPFLLFEHVNHFTPNSLKCIASKYGFTEIFTSQTMSSRPFGFVSVFKKSKVQLMQLYDYQINKQFFLNAKVASDNFFLKIENAREVIAKKVSNIIIWAANETTSRLLNNFELPENVFIIDSDSRKKEYFEPLYRVYLPNEAESAIKNSDVIIICAELHANDIIKFIELNYSKQFRQEDIYIIDQI